MNCEFITNRQQNFNYDFLNLNFSVSSDIEI